MRIAIFGGTGVVGTPLLSQALAAGHEVQLLVRTVTSVPVHPHLSTLVGDALDADDVAKTVVGCDAVLSTLGGYGDAEALDRGTANIVTAMRSLAVSRLVLVQGFHLPFPGDPHGLGARLATAYLRLMDRQLVPRSCAMARAIQEVDDLDWTLVRVPPVKPGGPTGRTRTDRLDLGPWHHVTAGDAAATMLAVLTDRSSHHTAPMVRSI